MARALSELVRTKVDGRVGELVLSRPEQMNAITVDLARALEQAVRAVEARADVIVIRGEGGNFSVGGDIDEVERLRAQGPDALAELFTAFGDACRAIEEAAVPVLAAVEGYALAGGFELILACDVAIVRADAALGDHHANFGAIPGGGSTQRLPRRVGLQRALGLILSGERLSGADAVAWGLAYRACAPEEFESAVANLAARLAGRSRDAQIAIKRLTRGALSMPLDEGLARERLAVVEHLIADGDVGWRG